MYHMNDLYPPSTRHVCCTVRYEFEWPSYAEDEHQRYSSREVQPSEPRSEVFICRGRPWEGDAGRRDSRMPVGVVSRRGISPNADPSPNALTKGKPAFFLLLPIACVFLDDLASLRLISEG